VVGKVEPVPIYEVVAKKGDLDETKKKALDYYQQGFQSYQDRAFADAIGHFEEGLSCDTLDGPCKAMIKRCETYIVDPPPPKWNGVYKMTSK
jgi:adenylate cyclase